MEFPISTPIPTVSTIKLKFYSNFSIVIIIKVNYPVTINEKFIFTLSINVASMKKSNLQFNLLKNEGCRLLKPQQSSIYHPKPISFNDNPNHHSTDSQSDLSNMQLVLHVSSLVPHCFLSVLRPYIAHVLWKNTVSYENDWFFSINSG